MNGIKIKLDTYTKIFVYYSMKNLKNLNHKELVNLWLTSQGDLSVPPHLRNGGNKELTNKCFCELLSRSKCNGGLNGVKR